VAGAGETPAPRWDLLWLLACPPLVLVGTLASLLLEVSAYERIFLSGRACTEVFDDGLGARTLLGPLAWGLPIDAVPAFSPPVMLSLTALCVTLVTAGGVAGGRHRRVAWVGVGLWFLTGFASHFLTGFVEPLAEQARFVGPELSPETLSTPADLPPAAEHPVERGDSDPGESARREGELVSGDAPRTQHELHEDPAAVRLPVDLVGDRSPREDQPERRKGSEGEQQQLLPPRDVGEGRA